MTSPSRLALLASLAAALAVTANLACGSQASTCGAPAATTYDCTPLDPDAGVAGCVGGANPLSSTKPDLDKVFPNGCVATTPACSPISIDRPEKCRCEPNRLLDGGLSWICPYVD